MTGGTYRSPTYGSELELVHFRVFPASYQLNELARLWEQTYPSHDAFEKDGLHPKAHFATYMIEIAMVEANLRCPLFHQTREGQPIVIVLADGWNHEGMSRAKIELYQMSKANVLDTATVGEFKSKFPA